MYTYIYIHAYVCIHIYVCDIYIYVNIYMYIYKYVYILYSYIYTYVHIYICTFIISHFISRKSVCNIGIKYIAMYVYSIQSRIHIFVYIYMHVCLYTCASLSVIYRQSNMPPCLPVSLFNFHLFQVLQIQPQRQSILRTYADICRQNRWGKKGVILE